ncbi:hypothetical protein SDC9_157900 [bioreactor metagenome]|uniref:Uncharacterized protein n=1 Tax=bioreactor metagenome TaxID=1076179 RepID=A0A645F8A7_9ZZZZ
MEDTLKIEIKDGRFLITAEQVVAEMDKRLEKGGYPKISDCKMTADSGTMAGFGDVTTQAYDLGEGVQLILYSDVDGNLIQVFYYVVPSKLTDEGSLYGFCCGLNFTMFAPDVDFGTLIDKLDIKNLTENTITSAHSEKSSFTYIVNGDSVMLSIMAN